MMTEESNGLTKRIFELLDRPEVSRVLFHPRRDPPQLQGAPNVHPLRIKVDQGVAVGGRLHVARPDGPTILFFHGNGEIASEYDGIAPAYTRMGVNLLAVDYRGYGSSDGQPTASRLLADASAVYRASDALLATHGLNRERLFVMGRSLGSAAAIEIAAHAGAGIAGLIIESGFAYTLSLLTTLGLRLELPETGPGAPERAKIGFGSLDKIAQVRVPTLIIHGEADWLIPVENGHTLYERCGAANKRLLTIPHAGHNDLLLVGQRAYFEAIHTLVWGADR
jgi:pimeloyl-ACP methyl ester carboxylesterase